MNTTTKKFLGTLTTNLGIAFASTEYRYKAAQRDKTTDKEHLAFLRGMQTLARALSKCITADFAKESAASEEYLALAAEFSEGMLSAMENTDATYAKREADANAEAKLDEPVIATKELEEVLGDMLKAIMRKGA